MYRSKLCASCGVALGFLMLPAVAFAQEGCKMLSEAHKLPVLTALLDSSALGREPAVA